MFKDSLITKRILRYGSIRIGQFVAPRLLAKVFSINSAESPYPKHALIDELHSRRGFKTVTSDLAMSMFHKDLYMDLAGDATIHGMEGIYGKDWDGRCIMVDEGNLLFKAMAKRSSQRWISAIATLFTRKRYEYFSERRKFVITGNISFVINVNPAVWMRHKEEIYELNLGDRANILHGWMNSEETFACKKRYKETMGFKSGVFIEERFNKPIRNLNDYGGQLKSYAMDYGTLGERDSTECLDVVTAIASENARLNQRDYLTNDDINVVRILRNYCAFPLSAKRGIKILMLLKEGKRPIDICHLLHRPPKQLLPLISYYKKKYLIRGALDLDET